VAGEDLIAPYLARVRAVVGSRPDADEIIAELEDHLRSGVERRVRDGLDQDAAQRESLEVIGDAGVVARELCRSSGGGVALPSRLSRAGGLAALLAAVLVMASLAPLYVWTLVQLDGRDTETAYWIYAPVLVASMLASLVGLAGVLARAGTGATKGPIMALSIAASGVALIGLFAWGSVASLAMIWGPYAFGLVRLRQVLPIPAAVWAHALAWPASVAVFAVLDELTGLGTVDSYGDYPWAWFVAAAIFAALWSVGQASLGRLLASERPVPTAPVPVAR
jgi:hypothetical protein